MVSVESAIESFREAALFPARWPQALDAFGQAFHSNGATLVLNTVTNDSIAVSTSIRPFVPLYMTGPIQDSREHRVRPALHEGFMPDHAYFSEREIATDPYYQELLGPLGFGWNAVARLQGGLMISVKRAFKLGPYEDPELRALDAALPWLRSVSRAACLTWHSNFIGHLSAFERLGRGAILLDRKARVLQVNACVRFGDGFDVADGHLRASCGGDNDRLRKFIASLLVPADSFSGSSQPPTLALPRPGGARPWLLDGIACADAMRSLHSEGAALVLVTDLEAAAHPKEEILRKCFGLTPVECALARRLIAGESLKRTAELLSISEGHARQRLKAIFQKTRTSRQGELIALLARIV